MKTFQVLPLLYSNSLGDKIFLNANENKKILQIRNLHFLQANNAVLAFVDVLLNVGQIISNTLDVVV